MRRQNILHLLPNLKREGAQIVVFNLAASRAAARTQCVVGAWQGGGALLGAFREQAVPVRVPARSHRFSTPRRTLAFIDSVVADKDIDLIHAHMPDAAVWGWLAARRRGLPLVITYHSNRLVSKSNPVWRFVRFFALPLAARYARRNIAVSASIGDRVRQSLSLDPDRISIVPNGVQIPIALPEDIPRRRDAQGPCIVAIGRLVELKGHEQLIAAAAILVQKYPTARFLIVGAGPLDEQLGRQVASLGLSEQVAFTGPTDDVPTYLREADVYVTMSHYEGLPLATLEAMAWGVPVVASDVPGHCDLIEHGVNGLLYPLGDIEALARTIARVIEEPDPARARALRAWRLVAESYSIDVVSRSYERIYSEVLGR